MHAKDHFSPEWPQDCSEALYAEQQIAPIEHMREEKETGARQFADPAVRVEPLLKEGIIPVHDQLVVHVN